MFFHSILQFFYISCWIIIYNFLAWFIMSDYATTTIIAYWLPKFVFSVLDRKELAWNEAYAGENRKKDLCRLHLKTLPVLASDVSYVQSKIEDTNMV